MIPGELIAPGQRTDPGVNFAPGQRTDPGVNFASVHSMTLVTVHISFSLPGATSRGG